MSSDFRKRTDRMLKTQMRTFGEQVTFYPKEGGVNKVEAIFDNAYQALDSDTQEIISSNQSVVHVNLNDFEGNDIEKGSVFKIRNTNYTVIDLQEDGQGGAMALLHKVRSEDEKTDLRKRPRSSR